MTNNLLIACEMFELGVAMYRQSLCRMHPGLSQDAIDDMVTKWLETRPGAEFGDAEGTPRIWKNNHGK